jgi:hypothetical protein
MLEALWSIEFVSNLGIYGAGVIIFETGRVFGGDSQYFYVGTCEVKHDNLEAEINVTHYHGQPFSIFGPLKKFKAKLTGKLQEPTMELNGFLLEDPNQRFIVRLIKRADLP